MKTFKQTLLALALGTLGMGSLSLMASEVKEHQFMVKIDKTDAEDALVEFKFDGSDSNAEIFTLPEMDEGESRVITTESGKTIHVTKTAEGINMDIDGKELQLPTFSGNLGARIQSSSPLHKIMENRINISGVELDENQQQIIRDAFAAAGIEDKEIAFSNTNIKFISLDGGMLHSGEHEMKFFQEGEAEFDMIIDSDSEVKVMTKVIHIEEDK